MLVRDRGGSWQLVRQPDHADLAGQFAAAWGGREVEPLRSRDSVILATSRHDDGWAVFDRRPAWDPDKAQPRSFLDVPVPSHLAFYRACIQVVADEDAYAGLLVSMHGAGVYRGRYGTQGMEQALAAMADHREVVDAFVAEQEATHGPIAAELGLGDGERWVNYRLLEAFDRLSLAFCLEEWEGSDAATSGFSPLPLDYDGTETELRIEPLGPWRVRLDPYPFAESPARFTVVRKVLLQGAYRGNDDFRAAYLATRTELVEITAEREAPKRARGASRDRTERRRRGA